MAARKSLASERTVPLFQTPEQVGPETIVEAPKGDRIPLEQDVDRLRGNAFKGQEWSTKLFARAEAEGNEYRVSYKDKYYYLETLGKLPNGRECHHYAGLMIHENDLLNAVTVLVAAVRDKQKRDQK